ncbi:hypothetical protein [Pedobacter boryungensis]|uniref:N-acetyltransferase domain-containing protein n=1 Tax=Pedobacter boryungensis TaxID=869962 RepID=A0ABX2D9L1_9SPHI|nr:hypothetical protein [Pedobacter boryungensis]NQX30717.1 hypothetical protein [Pedobacter boryungensis]
MGLNSFWQEDFFLTVQNFNHQTQIAQVDPYFIVECSKNIFIHLVPLGNSFNPEELITLQNHYQKENVQLIQLWEDIWIAKRAQVLNRIHSFLGFNKSFHGRKAKIEEVNQKQTLNFLTENHVQGYVKAKYSFGLLADNEIIGLASFSEGRPMKSKGENYQSAELVRFASKGGLTIVGGLSKLIKHFTKQIELNDLMTYADKDWSLGKGYNKLGFTLSEITGPAFLYVNRETLIRYFPHRLPKTILLAFKEQNDLNLDDFLALNGFVKLFNTGNLKYHLLL